MALGLLAVIRWYRLSYLLPELGNTEGLSYQKLNSFERARNEKHYEMIKDLNGDIEKVRKELSDYKNQVLEG